ncbi:formylglycine-generating enzyme required for sulfatase activity [Panacagrimonas perspica]|uniref:Formylglycine-generating enzyme required for sulfatase activity n=1 Tax=Panacagrimonas perspica TaxID=381431 RepID=A0A4R7P0X3_9GAMM|nr:formylglycine-generating enzyme family protein [Panacagrimonas perspica]TDU26879.1 formylglycine-generating enzyme required for sulfatase activity [Panacagrimonas perspica]THD03646.1 hypothetical protein B1810_08875 [Panacagrimonas perspica]
MWLLPQRPRLNEAPDSTGPRLPRSGAARAWKLRVAALALLSLFAVAPLHAADDEGKSAKPSAGAQDKAQKGGLDCPEPPPFATDPATGKVSYRDCADTPELVRLQGGTFMMGEHTSTGTLYERPLHEVKVPGFSIGKYELTFDEWDACVRARGCVKTPDDKNWGRGRRPVINITWVDAQQYVHWLSRKTGEKYRLPSEAEWEYAARAGAEGRYSWGEGAEWACEYGNVLDVTGGETFPNWTWRATCDDKFATTAPVGSFRGNPYGLYDMNGNVWEWVQDCWHNDYNGAPTDGSAWTSGGECGKRVNRGGGWGNHPRSMRSASRDADSGEGFSNAIGFRVVREN